MYIHVDNTEDRGRGERQRTIGVEEELLPSSPYARNTRELPRKQTGEWKYRIAAVNPERQKHVDLTHLHFPITKYYYY